MSTGTGAAGLFAARARARAAMAAMLVAAAAPEAAAVNGGRWTGSGTDAVGSLPSTASVAATAAGRGAGATAAGRGAGGTVLGAMGAAAVGVIAEEAMRLSQPPSAGAAGAAQMEAPGCAAFAAVSAAPCASIVACIATNRRVLRSSICSCFAMICWSSSSTVLGGAFASDSSPDESAIED